MKGEIEFLEILTQLKNEKNYFGLTKEDFKQARAIEYIINDYLKEKARANSLEEKYSKALGILDDNNLLDKLND